MSGVSTRTPAPNAATTDATNASPSPPGGTITNHHPDPGAETVLGTDSAASEELCGHRNMSGRTCTREHGHAAKSHRYS